MTTKQIIDQMEKEFDEKFPGDVVTMEEDGTHARITSSLYNRDSIKDFINKSIRTLLESFGEEIIGEDDAIPSEYVPGFEVDSIRDELRAEQRLKKKEIVKSLEK